MAYLSKLTGRRLIVKTWRSEVPTPPNPDTVTVRFNTLDGTDGFSEQMECGTTLTPPEIGNRNGYEFIGWEPEVPSTVPQTDAEFTAKWSPIEYTITYNMNGHGEVPSGALTKYTIESDEYTPHSPELVDGWTFNGWTPDILPEGSTGDFTFTANWVEQASPIEGSTRVWWSDDENDYSDIPITGELTQDSLSVDGHTYVNSVKVEIGDTVTSIGDNAFNRCIGLTSVTIPDSVTSIGHQAFYACSSLTSIAIPASVTSIGRQAFVGCNSLTSVTIPQCVISNTTLSYVFPSTYQSITDVVIQDNVTNIGDSAFHYCSSLTNMTIPYNVTRIGVDAFSGCSSLTDLTIPDNVTNIGQNAFLQCIGLTSVTFLGKTLQQVKNIKDENGDKWYPWRLDESIIHAELEDEDEEPEPATSDVTRIWWSNDNHDYTDIQITGELTSNSLSVNGHTNKQAVKVEIGNTVTSVSGFAFQNCSGLTSVTIPNSVTSIGTNAFAGCSGLTSVVIPDSVASIGDTAFLGCSGLTSILVDSGNANYKSVNGLLLSKDGKTLIQGVNRNVTIPDEVTDIGRYAFYRCNRLTSVTIPDSVTIIWPGAFHSCSGLTSATIGNSVTNIWDYAFSGCSGLTSLTIPDSVTNIGNDAFYNCIGLTDVTFLGKTLNQVLMIKDGNGLPHYSWGLDTSIIHAELEEEPITVTISWDLNGGTDENGNSTIPDTIIQTGSEIQIPNAIRDGYTFDGWWGCDGQLEPGTVASNNDLFMAMWKTDEDDDIETILSSPEFIETINQIESQFPATLISPETEQETQQLIQSMSENPPFQNSLQESIDMVNVTQSIDPEIDFSDMSSVATDEDKYCFGLRT